MNTKKLANYGAVVVSFSSGEVLETFLTSLASSDHTPQHVVIVENGPTPLTAPTGHPFLTSVVHLPHNPGYGAAVNEGVRALPKTLRWVLVSNPDVTLEPKTLGVLVSEATGSPAIGAVGPALVNPDGTVYPSARAIPGFIIGSGHALLGWIWPTNPWTAAYRGTYTGLTPRTCGWLSGACLLVSREAFDAIDGFDTGYFMFLEDVDLGMRLGATGWSSVYVPAARAHHSVGHATKSARPQMATAHHRSAKRFLKVRYPGALWWPLRAVVNVGLSVRGFIVGSAARLGFRGDTAA